MVNLILNFDINCNIFIVINDHDDLLSFSDKYVVFRLCSIFNPMPFFHAKTYNYATCSKLCGFYYYKMTIYLFFFYFFYFFIFYLSILNKSNFVFLNTLAKSDIFQIPTREIIVNTQFLTLNLN